MLRSLLREPRFGGAFLVQYRDFVWAAPAVGLAGKYSYAEGSDGAAVICGGACGLNNEIRRTATRVASSVISRAPADATTVT